MFYEGMAYQTAVSAAAALLPQLYLNVQSIGGETTCRWF